MLLADRYHWTPDMVNDLYPGFLSALSEFWEASEKGGGSAGDKKGAFLAANRKAHGA